MKSFWRSRNLFSKRGVAPPTYSRSARCRTFGASSQKFAEKTKFHKVLVKGGLDNYYQVYYHKDLIGKHGTMEVRNGS
jgi:hypothetical protein